MLKSLLRKVLSNGGDDHDPYGRAVREDLAKRMFAPPRESSGRRGAVSDRATNPVTDPSFDRIKPTVEKMGVAFSRRLRKLRLRFLCVGHTESISPIDGRFELVRLAVADRLVAPPGCLSQ
jgi:hypothetical protein